MLILLLCHSHGYPLCSNAPFQAPLYNTLIYVPDDKSLSHEFLKDFGTQFPYPRMFITRNVQRAIRKLGDSTRFFSQPKRPLSLIEEAGAVDEYKKALTFLKSKTPRAHFVMLLAHHSTQFETRLQELIQQDVFKGQHVITRVCSRQGKPETLELRVIS